RTLQARAPAVQRRQASGPPRGVQARRLPRARRLRAPSKASASPSESVLDAYDVVRPGASAHEASTGLSAGAFGAGPSEAGSGIGSGPPGSSPELLEEGGFDEPPSPRCVPASGTGVSPPPPPPCVPASGTGAPPSPGEQSAPHAWAVHVASFFRS